MEFVGTIGIKAIQVFLYIYDFVTYPIYFIIQNPFARVKLSNAVVAYQVDGSLTDTEVTYRPVYKSTPYLDRFVAQNIKTMNDLFDFAISQYSERKCLGTRHLLSVEKETQPNGKIFQKWVLGDYKWITFDETNRMATDFGNGLRHLGIEAHQNIAIFAETRAEWLICALACFKHNIPLVTIYANLGVDAFCYCIDQTDATLVITSQDLFPRVILALSKCPSIKCVVYIDNRLSPVDLIDVPNSVEFCSYKEVLKLGIGTSAKFDVNLPTEDDAAIIMFTSGSTGVPKGVVLPHQSLVATVHGFHFVVEYPVENDYYLGYLPLAHILELLSEMTMLVQGIPVGYSTPNTMIDKSTKIRKGDKGDCSVLQPTCMCAVPLVIDRIYKGIHENIRLKNQFVQDLLELCYRYKSSHLQNGYETPIIDRLLFRPMKGLVGGRLRVLLSGGAPLTSIIHDYVRCALDVPLVQGYGLTETCACACIMNKTDFSSGSVGPPLQGVTIKLVNWDEGNYKVTDKPYPRGEIIVGGRNVAKSYYRMPEKTAQDFYTDSSGLRWFRTGDIGMFLPNGSLCIIDRKKDLVKLQSGEYVSLGKVESQLKTSPLVENVCVYADSTEYYCVALVLPNESKLVKLATSLGLGHFNFEEMCQSSSVVNSFHKELSTHGRNSDLEKFELPGAIALITDLWTPDSGLVTAAFKLRRRPIFDKYSHVFRKLYSKTE